MNTLFQGLQGKNFFEADELDSDDSERAKSIKSCGSKGAKKEVEHQALFAEALRDQHDGLAH